MNPGAVLFLRGNEIHELLHRRELDIVRIVKAAYIATERGDASSPNCPFLRFPGNNVDRIIAKPSYVGGECGAAGIKWVASFPGNLAKGLERASATLILNSAETGLPIAVMEGSVISALRTAASAALAAMVLRPKPPESVGVVGCGLINFETLRFLLAVSPGIRAIQLYDLKRERAEFFARKCAASSGSRAITIADSIPGLLERSDVTTFATTAVKPHLHDLGGAREDSLILHISLRDFTPAAVLQAENIVDDVEHVCSNNTSLHLAQQEQGSTDFIRTTLGAILCGQAPAPQGTKPVLFSPFGLGALDVALGHAAFTRARETGAGTILDNFLPEPWLSRQY